LRKSDSSFAEAITPIRQRFTNPPLIRSYRLKS
jgi:hypothetical protein